MEPDYLICVRATSELIWFDPEYGLCLPDDEEEVAAETLRGFVSRRHAADRCEKAYKQS
jgi:hypothetical protein